MMKHEVQFQQPSFVASVPAFKVLRYSSGGHKALSRDCMLKFPLGIVVLIYYLSRKHQLAELIADFV